jgi:hypothetical protein
MSQVGFLFSETGGRRRYERDGRVLDQGLVGVEERRRDRQMRLRILRLVAALGAVAATALAGGASLKGF